MTTPVRAMLVTLALSSSVSHQPQVVVHPPELLNEPVQITRQIPPELLNEPLIINEPKIKVAGAEPEEEWISLGVMKISAYCPCTKCCGQYANGYTAIGTKATAGRTIGVNPRVIPYGSEVMIDGHIYIAEDTGGSPTQDFIDVFCDTHQDALNMEVKRTEVFVRSK